MGWRAGVVVPLAVLLAFSTVPGGVAAPVQDLEQDSPPGDYLVGPNATEGTWGATANDTSVHTQRSWQRHVASGETLTVELSWNEVATDTVAGSTNKFEYSVLINDSKRPHSPRTLDGDGREDITYDETGDYKITITGRQGITKYDIASSSQ